MLGLQPFGLPLPAPPILSAVLPFGFAQIGVLGAHPPSAYSPACARQFGYAFGQKPARLVCNGCFTIPPETRKVVGCASFPSFSRSVSTDYRLLSLRAKRVVLADKDCVLDSNFLFCGLPQKRKSAPINCFHFTPSLRSLRLWCIRGFRRFVTQCLITLCVLASPAHRQQGVLDRFAPRLRRLAKLSLTLDAFADKS